MFVLKNKMYTWLNWYGNVGFIYNYMTHVFTLTSYQFCSFLVLLLFVLFKYSLETHAFDAYIFSTILWKIYIKGNIYKPFY